MLKIRLQRVGRKHEPTFRVVLTDSQNSTKSGRFLEVLGSHDPRNKEKTELNAERISHWISKGAKPSDTLHNMFVSKNIIKGKKVNVLPKRTPIKKEVDQAAAAPAAAAPKAEAAPAPAAEPSTEASAS
jgi:small subunit ribosomal protein S16